VARSPSPNYMITGTAAPIEAISVKTSRAITCSLAGIPASATAAMPAMIRIRFFGLSAERTSPVPAASTA